MIGLFYACGFLAWTDRGRLHHVEHTTGLVPEVQKPEPTSPTGYAGGIREMIVPEHNYESYQWISQTQQMFARREWRVRWIDYENAPFGREVSAASPYRWWLGLIAWFDHQFSGRPLGPSVERAALFADPLMHLLLVVGTTVFVAWRFGALAAGLLAIGLVMIFPFAGNFLPGVPGQDGMAQACGLWSVLLLLAGIDPGPRERAPAGGKAARNITVAAGPHAPRWFLAGGLVGGVGMWISVGREVPILLGLVLGAVIAAWVGRGSAKEKRIGITTVPPWRVWALGGAASTFAAYLIEYFPSHLGSWQLRAIHPLYAIAWLGLGEVLTQVAGWIQGGRPKWNVRDTILLSLGTAAVAAVPVAMHYTANPGFLAVDPSSLRLTNLPDGVVALNLADWLSRDGFGAKVWATLLPVLLLMPAVWLLVRAKTGPGSRVRVALALGPVCLALGFACRQLCWWNEVDVILLAVLVTVTVALPDAKKSRLAPWAWSAFVVLLLLPGAISLVPPAGGAADALTRLEVEGLVERDLAHWLARHATGIVVLATPKQTAALHYYGGLRGLGTLDWENRDGFAAAVRIASATTVEEAFELISRREITHIIIPSWDTQLDDYAFLGLGKIEGSFIDRLHHWVLPPWLRAVPYQFPVIAGLEGQSILVFEVVEDQGDSAALSRTAEYFVEMGQLDLAAASGQALRRYPADLGALVARAGVEIARDDADDFARTVELVRTRVAAGADRVMPWDRRVSLAVVLARGKHPDLAREQVRRCLADINEAKLRALTTGSLYRLQVLARAFGLEIADPGLRQLALDLLPDDFRSHLKP